MAEPSGDMGLTGEVMLYGGSCLIVIRPDNGYPLLVFGHDQIERAEHVARVNGCTLIRCVPKEVAEPKEK